ncbi:MAG: UDP-N-acetylglucosamine 2-epimerase (non-hydrolyzing) [Crocinitomicaceae bacterium]
MVKKILIIVGTRPNFIKVTRFKKVAAQQFSDIELKIVHTGQHYDQKMSNIFFEQFGLKPDFFLSIRNDSPLIQMADIMVELEKLIDHTFCPDLMIVPGDVNSTFAASVVANKKNILLAHLESGLRSYDYQMPEEWNRILTDEIADHYFVTEPSGLKALEEEKKRGVIHYVGNTMIDTIVEFNRQISESTIANELNLEHGKFVLMTIHRPSNVDSKEGLLKLLELLNELKHDFKIVFPIHPRTRSKIDSFGLNKQFDEIKELIYTEPMSYFDFQNLVLNSAFVLTDSGGIQEETTFRQIPCLTLRENTERPVTIDEGTNTLVPFEIPVLKKYINEIRSGSYKKGTIPKYWDGKATDRILKVISEL